MTATVWVSTQDTPEYPSVTPGPGGPGEAWQRAGTVPGSREKDLWDQIQTYLGLRRARFRQRVDFYFDGDPQCEWVQLAKTTSGARFWIAFDIGSGQRYLVPETQAEVFTRQARRPPEGHPGLLPSVPIGVRLRATDGVLFDVASS
ncbi:hypothetical protein GCM10009642_44220 [Nocardiopsis metallicus]